MSKTNTKNQDKKYQKVGGSSRHYVVPKINN